MIIFYYNNIFIPYDYYIFSNKHIIVIFSFIIKYIFFNFYFTFFSGLLFVFFIFFNFSYCKTCFILLDYCNEIGL